MIVASPTPAGVIVNVVPLMDAVATDVALDDADNVHPLAVLTVVVLFVGYAVLPDVAPNVTPHATLFTVHVNVPVASL